MSPRIPDAPRRSRSDCLASQESRPRSTGPGGRWERSCVRSPRSRCRHPPESGSCCSSSDTSEASTDLVFEFTATIELFKKFTHEPLELLLGWLIIQVDFFRPHVASGRQDIVVARDLIQRHSSGEAWHIVVATVVVSPGVVRPGNLLDVVIGELSQLTAEECAELAGVNEEHLTSPFAVSVTVAILADEPQRNREPRVVEQLRRESNDRITSTGFQQLLAKLPLAALLRTQRSVRKHEARCALGAEVVDEVLHPGEVGVAGRRRAVLPARVIGQFGIPPVRDVE